MVESKLSLTRRPNSETITAVAVIVLEALDCRCTIFGFNVGTEATAGFACRACGVASNEEPHGPRPSSHCEMFKGEGLGSPNYKPNRDGGTVGKFRKLAFNFAYKGVANVRDSRKATWRQRRSDRT